MNGEAGKWRTSNLLLVPAASPNSAYDEEQEPKQEQEEEEEIGQVYQPRTPYYLPVHPPEFYDDEHQNFCVMWNNWKYKIIQLWIEVNCVSRVINVNIMEC